jgi:hypothetical protein
VLSIVCCLCSQIAEFTDLAGDLDDLSSRLQLLARDAAGAPLMTVDTGDATKQQGSEAWQAASEEDQRDAGGDAAEDWELV